MKNKKFLFISLLILAIGFAAVSTTLYISGQLVFGTNKDDFDIYFSKAYLDDVDVYDDVISQDKKTITFTTNELKKIDDTSTLEYQVMNNSREYDATVTVNCSLSDNKYVSYTNTLNDTILAQTVEDGVLVVTLDKVSTEEVTETLTCSLVYNAVERTSEADLYDENTYVLSGYLQDEEGNALTNQNLVVYSETPHIVTTNSLGYFYVENLLNEKHEIYITNKTKDELGSMTKEEVIESSISKGTFKVTNDTIILDNNYKLDKGKITVFDSFDKTCADLIGKVYNYDYTGGEQVFTVPCNGTYKLETWGAQGGDIPGLSNYSFVGGYGGYSVGNIDFEKNVKTYINIGGEGSEPNASKSTFLLRGYGGYNGGGNGGFGRIGWGEYGVNSNQYFSSGAGGGGATHFSLVSGVISTLIEKKDSILIVSGGGGGGTGGILSGNGGHGGGISGTILTSTYSSSSVDKPNPGTQTSGYKFGEGQSAVDTNNSTYVAEGAGGGGGGYYGGCATQDVENTELVQEVLDI